MQKPNKILLGWTAFAFVVIHTTAIVIYAFPQQFISKDLKRIATGYVHPVFNQTWSLFAPCPRLNSSLEVKFFYGADSTGWLDPMEDARYWHGILRGSHHSELALGESTLLFYLSNDVAGLGLSYFEPFPESRLPELMQTSSYWLLKNYLTGCSIRMFDQKPDAARVNCTYENVQTGEQGVLNLPLFTWEK